MFAVCHESFTFSSPKYRSAVSASGGLFCQITVIRRTGKMDKYDLQFGKIHPPIWINTFGKLDKYSGFFSFCLITVIGRYPIPKAFVRVKMDKYILQFGQIHFKIWINTSVFFFYCLITVIWRYPIPQAFVRVKMDGEALPKSHIK